MTFGKLMLHPAVQATGYALLQFVWQDALMAALLNLAGRLIRGSPRLRYALGCLALFSMPLVLGVTILRSYPHQRASVESAVAARRAGGAISVATEDSSGNSRIGRDAEFGSGTSPFLMSEAPITGWVACFWFAGIVTLSLRLAGGWARAQRLRTRDTEPAGEIWSSRLSGLARRLKVSRPVQLYLSARAEVPAVVGWIRPYILLPVSALTGLDEDQWAAVLAHELAHIRRHDYLVNLMQIAVETILFYHPAVWWVSRWIRQEREHCCDDLAVAVCGNVMIYAGALARLEELRGVRPEPAVAATGGDLLARIRRLTGYGRKTPRPAPLAVTVAAILPVLLVLASAYAPAKPAAPDRSTTAQPANSQSSPPLRFDVASVKACKEEPDTGGQRRRETIVTPGRATLDCLTLERMLFFAYAGIGAMDQPLLNSHPNDPNQVRGGPGWVRSEKFNITAKAEGVTDREVMLGPMLRALLEERFHLKTHREREGVTMYAMTVAKGGLKIQPIEPGGCTTLEATTALSDEERLALNRGDRPVCGNFGSIGDGVNKTWTLGGTTLTRFANSTLSGVLDHYVMDKTGLTGLFNIHLQFALDESIRPGVFGGGRPQDPPPPDIEKAPAIFQALEQQLGLKLEKTKGPHEFLVIDRVERPSEN